MLVIDLPITTKLAPSASASLGVMTRAWSPASSPSTRTPGVIKTAEVESFRSWFTSKAEHTIDVAPAAKALEAQFFTVSVLFVSSRTAL